jgi:hypothetical protein
MFSRIAVTFAAVFVAACATSQTRAAVNVPLAVPAPPPREPTPLIPVTVPPADTAAPAPTARTTEPPSPSSTQPVAAPAPATSAPPVVAVTPPAPAVAAPPATPPPELRSAGPTGRTLTAAQVGDGIGRAKRKLDAINRARLSAGQSADYDSARRFLDQAADAVKANNLLLAQSLVEKAETLADGLR